MLSVKNQIINNCGFAGHEVSVATSQLCRCGAEAAIDSVQMSRHVKEPLTERGGGLALIRRLEFADSNL